MESWIARSSGIIITLIEVIRVIRVIKVIKVIKVIEIKFGLFQCTYECEEVHVNC